MTNAINKNRNNRNNRTTRNPRTQNKHKRPAVIAVFAELESPADYKLVGVATNIKRAQSMARAHWNLNFEKLELPYEIDMGFFRFIDYELNTFMPRVK